MKLDRMSGLIGISVFLAFVAVAYNNCAQPMEQAVIQAEGGSIAGNPYTGLRIPRYTPNVTVTFCLFSMELTYLNNPPPTGPTPTPSPTPVPGSKGGGPAGTPGPTPQYRLDVEWNFTPTDMTIGPEGADLPDPVIRGTGIIDWFGIRLAKMTYPYSIEGCNNNFDVRVKNSHGTFDVLDMQTPFQFLGPANINTDPQGEIADDYLLELDISPYVYALESAQTLEEVTDAIEKSRGRIIVTPLR